jgi:hypothetical protein
VELEPDFAASLDFLQSFAPGGPWCLVAIEPDPPEGQHARAPGVVLSDPAEVLRWLDRRRMWNLYYSVNVTCDVRTTPTKAEVTGLRCLHVDVDLQPGAAANQGTFDVMLARLRALDPRATAIMFSGGGYQGIWRFPEDLPPSELLRVEAACRELSAEVTGGDHCWNANRLLRLPGTVNRLSRTKRSRGREPALAYLVEADWSRTWSFATDPMPRSPSASVEDATVVPLAPPSGVGVGQDIEDLPRKLRNIITTGDATRWAGDRSRAVWFVCCSLMRMGWSDAAVLGLITDPRWLISAHVREQPRPDAYAARQVRDARASVANDWERSTAGAILPKSQSNIRRALGELGAVMSYNEFSGRAWVNGSGPPKMWDDDAELTLRLDIDHRFDFLPEPELFRMVVRRLALDGSFHPVRDWLIVNEPTWDGIERTESWLIQTAAAEDTPFVRAVSRIVLVAAVRRVRQPGCKFDEMLVLVDPQQGTEKSTALRTLASVVDGDLFTDSVPLGAEPRRVIERTRGKWICEASDLAGMDRRHVAEMKDFLSRQHDMDRMVWDRHPTQVPRQFIIVGSTNEITFLKDTQNRRFWPVRTGRFDIKMLESMVPQLWAEASQLESAGASIRLDESLWAAAAEVQDEARAQEPWVDVLAAELGGMVGRVAAADAWKIIDKPTGMRSQEDNRRMGGAMRELGWERCLQRFGKGGHPQSAYVKGTFEERRRIVFILRDPVTRELSVGYDPPDFTKEGGDHQGY